MRYKAMWTVHH